MAEETEAMAPPGGSPLWMMGQIGAQGAVLTGMKETVIRLEGEIKAADERRKTALAEKELEWHRYFDEMRVQLTRQQTDHLALKALVDAANLATLVPDVGKLVTLSERTEQYRSYREEEERKKEDRSAKRNNVVIPILSGTFLLTLSNILSREGTIPRDTTGYVLIGILVVVGSTLAWFVTRPTKIVKSPFAPTSYPHQHAQE